jgi:hypothetical protein
MALMDEYRTASFEQVTVMGPRVGKNKAAVEGACHNFSLNWISLILNDPLGSSKDRMVKLSANSGGANPVLQKVFGDRWGLEGASGADDMMCQINGLTTQDVFAYKVYDKGELSRGLLQGSGLGFVYSFWFAGGRIGAEGGAHSVAFYTVIYGSGNAIHFFDPNFGEFVFNATEFDAFWTELTGMYGPLKNHWLRSAKASAKVMLGGR